MGVIGSYFSNFAPISSPGLLIMDQKLYRLTKLSTDMSVDYRPTLDRYIERLSSDYRPSVDQPSTECPPILLTDTFVKYRPTIGEKSAKCQWMKSYISRHTSGTTVDRLSTDNRYIDRLSTECWPTIDRVLVAISTDISVDTTYSKQDLMDKVLYNNNDMLIVITSGFVSPCRWGILIWSWGTRRKLVPSNKLCSTFSWPGQWIWPWKKMVVQTSRIFMCLLHECVHHTSCRGRRLCISS